MPPGASTRTAKSDPLYVWLQEKEQTQEARSLWGVSERGTIDKPRQALRSALFGLVHPGAEAQGLELPENNPYAPRWQMGALIRQGFAFPIKASLDPAGRLVFFIVPELLPAAGTLTVSAQVTLADTQVEPVKFTVHYVQTGQGYVYRVCREGEALHQTEQTVQEQAEAERWPQSIRWPLGAYRDERRAVPTGEFHTLTVTATQDAGWLPEANRYAYEAEDIARGLSLLVGGGSVFPSNLVVQKHMEERRAELAKGRDGDGTPNHVRDYITPQITHLMEQSSLFKGLSGARATPWTRANTAYREKRSPSYRRIVPDVALRGVVRVIGFAYFDPLHPFDPAPWIPPHDQPPEDRARQDIQFDPPKR